MRHGTALHGIGAILVVGVLRMLLALAQGDLAARLGGAVRADLRGAAVAAALVPSRLHDTTLRDGSTTLALGDGIDGTDVYVSKYIPAVAQLIVGSVVAVGLVAVLSPVAAACVALGILLAVLGPLLWKRMLASRGVAHWDTYEALSGDLLEASAACRRCAHLGDVPATRTRLHGRSEALRRATERVMRSSLAETAITDLAVQAGVVAAAGLAVVSVMTGRPPAVEVYALLLLASEAFRPVRDLSRQWHAGFLGLTAVPGLVALGPSREAPCPRRPMSTASPAARRRTPPVGRLLPVPRRGARRAQPHRPPRGARRGACDRRFVRCGQVHAVRRHPRLPPRRIGCRRARRAGAAPLDVAVVSQRPVLFAGTIRENVDLFGVGQEALERACAAAGVLDEIRAVPGGFDAQVRRRERACRAGSGSGSRSPGPCSPAVPCCSSMSRPARSTTRPRRRGGDLARGPQRGSCS